jgi:hypothetical protein
MRGGKGVVGRIVEIIESYLLALAGGRVAGSDPGGPVPVMVVRSVGVPVDRRFDADRRLPWVAGRDTR